MAGLFFQKFPFLFGGTFIEGYEPGPVIDAALRFPFLFGGTFIEGRDDQPLTVLSAEYFPSFSEGLSLRVFHSLGPGLHCEISLPFRRDFH